MATIRDAAGNDTLTGTADNDKLIVTNGGEDTVSGLAGNDVVTMNAAFDAGDRIDGGDGSDQLWLRGDYSAGVTLGATTLTSVERIVLGAGNSYALTTNDANLAAGANMVVDASKLGAADALHFDGSAETDGSFDVIGGAGNDVVKGGAFGDTFDMRAGGGEDSFTGGAGNDLILTGDHLDAGDRIDAGGGANNVLRIDGDYSAGLTLGDDTIKNIKTLQFDNGDDFVVTAASGNFAPGTVGVINASALRVGHYVNFDASASSAGFKFTGGTGDDVFTGGKANNSFDLSLGGGDSATGNAARDAFFMGDKITAADRIDGGAGSLDSVELFGLSGPLVMAATTMVNVETLLLDAGDSYSITTDNATVAAGATLLIRGENLAAGQSLHFNGAVEADGTFIIRGGAGDDVLTGGRGGDTYNLTTGGNDNANGGSGNDTINMGGALTAADKINGGNGTDIVTLSGDYSAGLTLGVTTITNVETLNLGAGHSYNITTNDATVAAHATMTVDGSALGAGDSLVFDGSAETDGALAIKGGAGDDTVTLGAQLAANHDTVDGGGGNNTLVLAANPASADPGGANLDGSAFQNIDTIKLAAGQTYQFAVSGDITGGHGTLNVDASALAASNSATIDLSQATTSTLNFTGGAGDDSVNFGGNFATGDSVDGGGGNNSIALAGTYSDTVTFDSTAVTNIGTVTIGPDPSGDGFENNYVFTGDITGGKGTLTVDATGVGGDDLVQTDFSQATTATINFSGGAGDSYVTFTAANGNWGTIDGGTDDGDTLDFEGGSTGITLSGSTITHENYLYYGRDANWSGVAITGDLTGTGDAINVTSATNGSFQADFSGATDDVNFGANSVATAVDVTFGAGNDVANVGAFGTNTIRGGGGDDMLFIGALATQDDFNGGIGNDTITIAGPGGSTTLRSSMLQSVETFKVLGEMFFTPTTTFTVTVASDVVAAGQTMTVDASQPVGPKGGSDPSAHTNLVFNGAAEVNGGFRFIGGGGNDTFTANNLATTFDMTHGGNDTVHGGAGGDTITMAGTLTAADSLDGGAGSDTVTLDGDYSAGLTLGAATLTNVETVTLAAGHSYDITSNDGNVAQSQTLTVDGSALGAGNTLTFNGSAETNGKFNFIGGAGNDVLTGGARANTFDLTHGGNDTAHGGTNSDTFNMGSTLTAADRIDGGGGFGTDTLMLSGDYSAGLALGATTLTNIKILMVAAGHSYDIITNDGTVAAGGGMVIAATTLGAADTLTFDGRAETDGTFAVFGGAGDDYITAATERLTNADGEGGNDTLALTSGGTLTDELFRDFENLRYSGNASGGYTVSLVGDLTAGGGTLSVNLQRVTNGGATIDLSATTTASVGLLASNGNDTVIAAASTVGNFTIDGGAGSDTLEIAGGASGLTLDDTHVKHVEKVAFADGASYSGVAITGDLTSGGGTLTIDASALTGSNSVAVDFSQETTNTIFATGGAGDDTFIFSQSGLNAVSSLDGGGGNNMLVLNGHGGDVNANLQDSIVHNIENIVLTDGNNYVVDVTGDITSGHGTLSIDASALSDAYGANINVNNAPTATINVTGGAGDDVVSVWASDVTVDFSQGGNDTFFGGPGNALIEMGGALTADDTLYGLGGPGQTTVSLDGDYSAGITLSMLNAVNAVELGSGHNYDITLVDTDLTSGAFLLDGSALGAGDSLTADATAMTSAGLDIIGGAGADTIEMGAQFGNLHSFDGGGGDDTIAFTPGSNTFTLNGAGFTSLEDFRLGDNGGAYDITLTGRFTSSPDGITVDASNVSPDGSYGVTVDFSGDTDDLVGFNGSAGIDNVTVASVTQVGNIYGGDGDLGNTLTVLTGGTATWDGASIRHIVFTAGMGTTDITDDSDTTLGTGYSLWDASALGADSPITLDFAVNFGSPQVVLGPDTVYNIIGTDTSGATLSYVGGSTSMTVSDANLKYVSEFQFDGSDNFTGVTLQGDVSQLGVLSIYSNLTGGAHLDIDISQATTPAIQMALDGGDDVVHIGDNLGAIQQLQGNGGDDTLVISGASNNALTLTNSVFQGVGNLVFDASVGTEDLTIVNDLHVAGDFGNGTSFSVDASALTQATLDTSALSEATTLIGTAGDDIITGCAGADMIDDTAGGNDVAHGGGDDDLLRFLASNVAGDTIDGGSGNDTLLVGDGGTGSVGDVNASSIETLAFAATGSDPLAYSFTVTGDITSGGGTLTVDASSLNDNDTLDLDLTGATTAANDFLGGAGDDTVIYSQPSFFAEQAYNGGAGYNTIAITPNDGSLGPFEYNLGDAYFTNLDKLVLQGGSDQGVQITGDVSHTGTLIVDASALGAGYSATIDASAATSSIDAIGGGGADVLTGGAGADVLTGGALSDTFQFNAVSDSTSAGYDTITDIDFSSDRISLVGAPLDGNTIDAAINGGSLSTASFDSDLASAVDAAHLGAHDAVLFTADSGALSGHTFLVVDHNGQAGYQAGADYVIDVTGYTGTLTTASFGGASSSLS